MRFAHIAGTNGKGSVSEYLSRIGTAAGCRTGCFTSPHLVSPTERFLMDGREIAPDALDALMDEVRRRALAVNDTLFAAYTAAALLWFERQHTDFAVIETGIGGRYDSTNVITPAVSVLTPVSFDHTALLGDTLEKIAADKSGIIKRGVPVVSAAQPPGAMAVIERESRRLNAPLTVAPPARILSASVSGQTFELEGRSYFIRAMGSHQPQNAALAVKAAQLLGFSCDAAARGLADAALRCRAQLAAGEPDILLDGAHNEAAVIALCGVLDGYFAGRKKVLLFACMKDKDYAPMIDRLAPYFDEAFVTALPVERAEDPKALCARFGAAVRCAAHNDALTAFAAAKAAAKGTGALLVVCGSFYLAGLVEPWVTVIKKERGS